jgi:hypothetical protein
MPSMSLDLTWAPASIHGAVYRGWTDEECLWRRRSRTAVAGANNLTRALSATDTSPGDLTGLPCTTGYCHLEGPRVSDSDAYGAGLVKVASP